MYFSKNSRYVLRRAKCMSPSFCLLDCLKGTTKNFSVKSPKDDPTKPPLRLNIPNEEKTYEQYYNTNYDPARIHKKDASQPRSRSLLSKPSNKQSLTKAYDDDYVNLPRSESEKQFKHYAYESDDIDDQFKPQNLSPVRRNHAPKQEIKEFAGSGKKSDSREPKSIFDENLLYESGSKKAMAKRSIIGQNKELNESENNVKISSSLDASDEQRALYIIVDIPDKSSLEEPGNVSFQHSHETDGSAILKISNDSSKTRTETGSSLSKTAKPESKERSKSLPKNLEKAVDLKQDPKIKFQVHEIDEAATYVFQLKFKKNMSGKSFTVGCVPEKELNMRAGALGEEEARPGGINPPPLTLSNKTYMSLDKEITTIEDPLEPVTYTNKLTDESEKDVKETFENSKKNYKTMKKLNDYFGEIHKARSSFKKDIQTKKKEDSKESLKAARPEAKQVSRSMSEATAKLKSKAQQHSTTTETQEGSNSMSNAAPDKSSQKSFSNYPEKLALTAGKTSTKVENAVKEVSDSEYYIQEQSSKSNKQSTTSVDKQSQARYVNPQQYYNNYQQYALSESNDQQLTNDYSQSQYSQKDYQQYYQSCDHQESGFPEEKRYDPDAKEYYYYFIEPSQAYQEAETAPPAKRPRKAESSIEKLQKTVRQNTNFQKPYGRKNKHEKNSKNERKRGKNEKFSNSRGGFSNKEKKFAKESMNFQTSAEVVKASSEPSQNAMRFCAAYPPTLNEMMISRTGGLGLRKRETFFNSSSAKFNFHRQDFQPNSLPKDASGLTENSILFPSTKSSNFDCSSLFGYKKSNMLTVIKSDENTPKISDNMLNVANEELTETKGEPSLDSLTMMKKVKEIVDFDLKNAVKLFEGRGTGESVEVKSVVIQKGDGWELDEETLNKCIALQRVSGFTSGVWELNTRHSDGKEKNGKIDQQISIPIYLPGKKENETTLKLDSSPFNSVVTFNQTLGTFHVNKTDLEEAICRRDETFSDMYVDAITPKIETFLVYQTNSNNPSSYEMKSGDSILVFDELTQTWKVDYSILEKRDEQMRQEEELTRRSEIILETIEKLEKGKITTVPKPDSREKKIFDYTSEEWKAYKPNESSTPSKNSTKTKHPFKESDAGEIRKKNSDLYDNLFVVNKKETKMNKDGKEAPGLNTSNTKKETADKNQVLAKDSDSGKSGPNSPPSKTEMPFKESNDSVKKKEESNKTPAKEDDDFWGNFLHTNILPFDMPERPKPRLPPKPIDPPKPTPPPKPPKPPVQQPSVEKQPEKPQIKIPPIPDPVKPDIKVPPSEPKKIIDPKFKIPSLWERIKEAPQEKTSIIKDDKKPIIPNAKIPPLKEGPLPKTDVTKKDSPTASIPLQAPQIPVQPPPPSTGIIKKDGPAIKPPPASPNVPKQSPPHPSGIIKKESPPAKVVPQKIPPTPPGVLKQDPLNREIGKRKGPLTTPVSIIRSQIIEKKKPKQEPVTVNSEPLPTKKNIIKPEVKIPVDIKNLNLPPPTKPESLKLPPDPRPTSPGSKKKVPLPSGPTTPEPKNLPPAPSSPPVKKSPPPPAPPAAPNQSKTDPSPPKMPPTIGLPGKGNTSPPKEQPPPPLDSPDPRKKSPPTIGSPQSGKPEIKASKDPKGDKNDLKTKGLPSISEKKDKNPSEHYISENIVEMSKNFSKDLNIKGKPSKIETVRVNITPDRRMPSKITEINLNKKYEESVKESVKKEKEQKKSSSDESIKKNNKVLKDNRTFYKNFEKYKSPFSDPEYEEKPMKINSDIKSNPNLKKLDNWNKTLVLHDIVKPPENIESWLKDETDKMATLLLKVLQEAAEGKPRKKATPLKAKSTERPSIKGNPYDNIRKKQENTPESFLFKVRSVNLALEAEKKLKLMEGAKKSPSSVDKAKEKNIPVQSAKNVKPPRIVEAVKYPASKDTILQTSSSSNIQTQSRALFADPKPKLSELTVGTVDPHLSSGDTSQTRIAGDVTDDIPGPEILKKISSTWKLFPQIGCQLTIFTLLRMFQLVKLGSSFFSSAHPDKSRRHAFNKLFAKYGPIVNLQGPLSGNVILIHKPEHLTAVFEQDALSPVRSIFDSLDQGRREVDERNLVSVVPTEWSKPEWNDFKKVSSDPMLKGCDKFYAPIEFAGDCLVNNIRRSRNNQNYVSEDFMEEIKRWSLEGLCSVLFARSFGFLEGRSSNVNWLLEPDKLFLAVEEATEYLTKCERGFQMWRLVTTPSLLGLSEAYKSLATILSKQLYQAEISLKHKRDHVKENNLANSVDLTYIESMLLFDGMAFEEITCNLVDTLLVGTNALSSSLGFLLYHLAQNVKVQQRLLQEVKEVLPNKTSRLDYQKLQSSKYLHACLKESLRLNTPFPLFFRLLQNDIILSNYVVPKGTYIVMDSRVSCMKEQIFDEPEKFVPERWLNEDKWMQNSHPFLSFPMCHGPRSELAKRIVEMQLCSCVAKIVRNFEIEYHFGEILGTENIISFPNKPLKLNFIERTD